MIQQRFMKNAVLVSLTVAATLIASAEEPRSISGVYPHLTMYNNEGECGTGAVVPWADRLWVITYGPHLPFGSSDKLYEITPELGQIIRPESVGGTPANRMIHGESQQLFIGPYVIGADRNVRVLPPKKIPGRLTGNARHLSDPAGKIYYATMEEGLYEVDVKSLAVTSLILDGNPIKKGFKIETPLTTLASQLPGYHGKGLFSSQGRLVYANNGDRDPRVIKDPATPSGALGEWRKAGEDWQLVRRNQFTEVTGPGGIHGAEKPETDPVWSVGWDHRSLILMCLDAGVWHSYRLPKGSHSYDGAHGWNTEWPRIREIGEKELLMTMHGTFWTFPASFTSSNSGGISPRSNYLKVIGDFARWGERVVFGCDDSAKSEFLNKRKAKGDVAGPGRSHSNLWFVKPEKLDQIGPVIGRGAVWLADAVKAGVASEPYLFAGYDHRAVHVVNEGDESVKFTFETDEKGNGTWTKLSDIELAAHASHWMSFPSDTPGIWVRLKTDRDASRVTAWFHYRNRDPREAKADEIFAGLAGIGDKEVHGGVIHARGGEFKTLHFVAGELGAYDLDASLKLAPANDPTGAAWTAKAAAIPKEVITVDAASVLYVDEKGRWRLPKGDAAYEQASPLGSERVCREVCTERDMLNAGGTFFELPAENAGGMAKIRPIATHNLRIQDYASYRGLLVMTGLKNDAAGEHILRSDDGKVALWAGAVDDLWKAGKPRGVGGPLKDTKVKAGEPSDPYLMTGYDQKSVSLSHTNKATVKIKLEVDITGTGLWCDYRSFDVAAGETVKHDFPESFSAYWVRAITDTDTAATAQFEYR